MEEKEGFPPHIHIDEEDTHGIIIPGEAVITPEGTSRYIQSLAGSEEASLRVLEIYAEATGGEIVDARVTDPSNQRGSSRTFFSSKNWRGSKWEPQGPKSNGGYLPPEPADPRQN